MDGTKMEIDPITMTKVTVISKINIKRVEVALKQYAEITFDLIDNNDNYAGTKFVVMSGEDYANWGKDDDYLINWVLNWVNINLIL
jgi:hypothetical protein